MAPDSRRQRPATRRRTIPVRHAHGCSGRIARRHDRRSRGHHDRPSRRRRNGRWAAELPREGWPEGPPAVVPAAAAERLARLAPQEVGQGSRPESAPRVPLVSVPSAWVSPARVSRVCVAVAAVTAATCAAAERPVSRRSRGFVWARGRSSPSTVLRGEGVSPHVSSFARASVAHRSDRCASSDPPA